MNGETDAPAAGLSLPPNAGRRAWLGVCAAAVSIFLFVADSALTAIALPSIEATFAEWPRSAVGWVASSFVVAQASMLLVAGQLGDRRGRKRFYLLGLAMYTAGALIVSIAPTLPVVIAARVIQGFGAAFLTSGALPLVLPLFPESKAPRVIGTWGAIGSVAAWLTPTAGGALVEANWRLAYAAIVPIGVAAFLLGARVLPEHRPAVQNPLRIDRGDAGVVARATLGMDESAHDSARHRRLTAHRRLCGPVPTPPFAASGPDAFREPRVLGERRGRDVAAGRVLLVLHHGTADHDPSVGLVSEAGRAGTRPQPVVGDGGFDLGRASCRVRRSVPGADRRCAD
jgi:MFS family permease